MGSRAHEGTGSLTADPARAPAQEAVTEPACALALTAVLTGDWAAADEAGLSWVAMAVLETAAAQHRERARRSAACLPDCLTSTECFDLLLKASLAHPGALAWNEAQARRLRQKHGVSEARQGRGSRGTDP